MLELAISGVRRRAEANLHHVTGDVVRDLVARAGAVECEGESRPLEVLGLVGLAPVEESALVADVVSDEIIAQLLDIDNALIARPVL